MKTTAFTTEQTGFNSMCGNTPGVSKQIVELDAGQVAGVGGGQIDQSFEAYYKQTSRDWEVGAKYTIRW